MSASPSFPTPADKGPNKWKKRKNESNLRNATKKQQQRAHHNDDDEDDDEEEDPALEEDDYDNEENEDSPAAAAAATASASAAPNPESEILSDSSTRIFSFPSVVKHTVNRLPPLVVALASADGRSTMPSLLLPRNGFFLENISHGQIQAVSLVPSGSHALSLQDQDRPEGSSPAYVCTPPPIMEGKGVVKDFGNQCRHVLPMHSDWFSPTTVHRLERQVVPHFFSGKSNDHTPERYMEVRNRIVSKYMENPDKRLSVADCQGLNVGVDVNDLNRIVRFLDHWGIINYMAVVPSRHGFDGPVLRDDVGGELHVPSGFLRSIDSLIRFDKPKSRLRPEEVSSSPSSSSEARIPDLDARIRERLAEHRCNYCSRALTHMFYQSQKADTILCSDCFHDGKFVAGSTSIDFVKVNSIKDFCYLDGDSWTDQETLLLLEALEMFGDNWNDIAEHVGTKSKAQCILQFIRLPMEDGLLENIELPATSLSSDVPKEEDGKPHANINDDSEEASLQDLDTENELPFTKSGNPVMAQVAFLASAVGPRVAAACAHASLSALSKEESNLNATNAILQIEGSDHVHRLNSKNMNIEGGAHAMTKVSHQTEHTLAGQGSHGKNDAAGVPLSPDSVRMAAKFGLSAAATKAKMFADHEEREIQRWVAAIVNHQLKRLELKLKQFAEVETLLMKECEQVERTRQRLSAERARMISTQLGSTGNAQPGAVAANNSNNSNIRPSVVMPGTATQPSVSAYSSNPPTHPHMSFMPRQSMYSFGPRLPLSMIHPSSSASSASVVFPSRPANAPVQNHPILRPVSGTNTNVG